MKLSNTTLDKLSIVAALASFIVLSFFTLFIKPFWLDEAAVGLIVSESWTDIIHRSIESGHSLGYIIPLKLWTTIFGNSPIGLRSFSILSGALLVLSCFVIGKRTLKSENGGRLSLWLCAFNALLIYYAVESKTYLLSALLLLWTYYFLVQLYTKRNTRTVMGLALISAIGLYTHQWFWLVYGSLCIGLLASSYGSQPKKELLRLIASLAIGPFLALPALYVTSIQVSTGAGSYMASSSGIDFGILISGLKHLSYGWPIAMLLITLLAIVKNRSIVKGILASPERMMLVWGVLLPFVIATMFSPFKSIYVPGRYEVMLTGLFSLLIAEIWASGFINVRWRGLLAATMGVACLGSVLVERNKNLNYGTTSESVFEQISNLTPTKATVITMGLNYAEYAYQDIRAENPEKLHIIPFPDRMGRQVVFENVVEMSKKDVVLDEGKRLVQSLESSSSGKTIWLICNTDYPDFLPFINYCSERLLYQGSLNISDKRSNARTVAIAQFKVP